MANSTNSTKDFIVEQIKKQIEEHKSESKQENFGKIMEIGDGIAKISGLSNVMMSEMIEFRSDKGTTYGLALNLNEDSVGVVILGEYEHLKEGDEAVATGKILEVPTGEELTGRVVNPLGQALDNKEEIKTKNSYPVEKIAPGVMTRAEVNKPVQTGIKSIDAMFPIGRGQRELIIGDRQIGKTAIAIDTIINQKGKNMKCVYVAIGQKESKIANIVAKLEEEGAMEYTTVVVASASDPASLLYIAPYAGTSIAEYFLDQGEDALVVYDDLSKHAVAYREISLLLKRPPGREAFPGDVFYLHSRLLERACKLNSNYGGGSITALPIIETQAGDVSAYIPTNVISITDGQIYLEPDLFNKGNRPAINTGLSVSRVGSSAQLKAMKKVAGKLKLEAAQYEELAAFAQFGSDLEAETKKKLERGKRLMEVLKQDQYAPVDVLDQIIIYYALTRGFIDNIPVEKTRDFEQEVVEYVRTNAKETLDKIQETGKLEDEQMEVLSQVIGDFKDTIDYTIKEEEKEENK